MTCDSGDHIILTPTQQVGECRGSTPWPHAPYRLSYEARRSMGRKGRRTAQNDRRDDLV